MPTLFSTTEPDAPGLMKVLATARHAFGARSLLEALDPPPTEPVPGSVRWGYQVALPHARNVLKSVVEPLLPMRRTEDGYELALPQAATDAYESFGRFGRGEPPQPQDAVLAGLAMAGTGFGGLGSRAAARSSSSVAGVERAGASGGLPSHIGEAGSKVFSNAPDAAPVGVLATSGLERLAADDALPRPRAEVPSARRIPAMDSFMAEYPEGGTWALPQGFLDDTARGKDYIRKFGDMLNDSSGWLDDATMHANPSSPTGLLPMAGGPAPGLMRAPEVEDGPGLMAQAKPEPKPTPSALDLLKLGVRTDMERAGNAFHAVADPLRRLFAEGGWPRGPQDQQSATDMRDTLLTTGLGATALSSAPTGALGTFVGHRAAENLAAKGFRKPNDWGGANRLRFARDAERGAVDPSDIWDKHGWMRGPDGKWRTEIDDRPLRVNMDNPASNVGIHRPKGEIYHPELAAAYPEFADLTTWAEKGATRGAARAAGKGAPPSIEVYGPDAAGARGTAAHELQHQASNLSGFDVGRKGADSNYRVSVGEVEARNVEKRLGMSMLDRRFTPPWETHDVPAHQQVRSPRINDDLGDAGRQFDKTRLEVTATGMAREARALEDRLRSTGTPPDEIARQLERRFGDKLSAADIASGNVWWRIDEMPGVGSGEGRVRRGQYASTEQITPELKGFLRSEEARGLSNKELAATLRNRFGVEKTPNAVRHLRERRALPKVGRWGGQGRISAEHSLAIDQALASDVYRDLSDKVAAKKMLAETGIKISYEGIRLRRKKMRRGE